MTDSQPETGKPVEPYQRSVYYQLWDLLNDQSKARPEAKEAQAAYGVDTMRAISLLTDLLSVQRQAPAITEPKQVVLDYLIKNQWSITNALEVFARYMTDASNDARVAHKRGDSHALITNDGYRMSAELFAQNAANARKIAARLNLLVDAVEDEK